jgi:hypothetical protein
VAEDDQRSIFDDLPDPRENRVGKFHGPASGAPDTQRAAAILVYPKTGIARERVLRNIIESGEFGVIDEDGYRRLRMIQNTYIPRRNELTNDGWIKDSGRRRETAAGAQAVVWVATERALVAIRRLDPLDHRAQEVSP